MFSDRRVISLEDREYLIDRLDFVRNQMNLLIQDIKKKIEAITKEVENKVNQRNPLTVHLDDKNTLLFYNMHLNSWQNILL